MTLSLYRRTTDNGVLNSTSRVDDPVLQASLDANSVYRVLLVATANAGTTADVGWGISYTGTILKCAGKRLFKHAGAVATSAIATDDLSASLPAAYNNTGFMLNGSATASHRGWIINEGFIWTDTAGVLSLRHAQNTLNASQTAYIHAGSWMVVEKLDNLQAATCLYVQKSADEARTNTTTYADDSELALTLGANKTYLFEALLQIKSSPTPDAKVLMVSTEDLNPSYDTFLESNVLVLHATAAAVDTTVTGGFADQLLGINFLQPSTGGNSIFLLNSVANGVSPCRVLAIIDTGTNAPTIKVQWAQNALDAVNATTMLKGSCMWAREIP